MNIKNFEIHPKFDLVLERVVDVPAELLWKGWTEPDHLKRWFCPKPWKVTEAKVDLRPGGIYSTTMRGPEGQEFLNVGCCLDIVKDRKLVWTSALGPDYRPMSAPQNGADLLFTGIILLEPKNTGTRYTAIAMHSDEASCKKHAEMGFHEGWGICLDQLVECIRKGEIK